MEPAATTEPSSAPARSGWQRVLDRYFTPLVAALCALYLAIEILYVERIPLSMDEFQGAHDVHRLRDRLPYAEFSPYKTVLGYYLQLPWLLLGDDAWSSLIWAKRGMACCVALSLFFVARSFGRVLERGATLLSLLALLATSTFLERSAELRVDMLTALAGLFSFAWLLERRFVVAGLAAGTSFLVSQKGAYYCAAGAIAIASHAWVVDRRVARLRDVARFGLAAVLVVAAYLLAWSFVAPAGDVASRTIARAARAALADPYATLWKFWRQTLERNPYFYAASGLGIGVALDSALRTRRERDWYVWTYAGTVLVACLWHKQPWPYFFVLLIPFLWGPLAVLFERLERRTLLFWLLFLGLGLGYPLQRAPTVLAFSSAHQRHAVNVAEHLLGPNERYLAGVHVLHTREQTPAMLAWLDKSTLERVKAGRVERALDSLRADPPKLLLWNYRLDSLPPQLRRYLLHNYEGLSGAVRVYAPYVGERRFEIAHAGKYRLIGSTAVVIDERKVEPDGQLRLDAGAHRADRTGFRLVWTPSRAQQRVLAGRRPGGRQLFDDVYSY